MWNFKGKNKDRFNGPAKIKIRIRFLSILNRQGVFRKPVDSSGNDVIKITFHTQVAVSAFISGCVCKIHVNMVFRCHTTQPRAS